jgi:hypothetical protein
MHHEMFVLTIHIFHSQCNPPISQPLWSHPPLFICMHLSPQHQPTPLLFVFVGGGLFALGGGGVFSCWVGGVWGVVFFFFLCWGGGGGFFFVWVFLGCGGGGGGGGGEDVRSRGRGAG